jgi:hypothetical protein
MKGLKSSLSQLFVIVGLLGGLALLYGCAPTSLGPQEPLLPTIEGSAKFSDRFELEEEPQFFYDLFGKELLEGNQVHEYVEEKEFDQQGNLIIGSTGQLDSDRFVAQLDRTILTEDTYRGRHTEFAIGDHMRIKPETLFPNQYIIYKTEFDGLRWDVSFSQERHLFTLLNSRISNPVHITESGAGNISGTLGKRNRGDDPGTMSWLENARLVGFRGQGMLGDIFRVGLTYINLHKEHPGRIENPMMGTVANTPPDRIVITFRDNSPEDNHPLALPADLVESQPDRAQGGIGAAFKGMTIKIATQRQELIEEEERGIDEETGEEVIIKPAKYEQQPEEELPEINVTVADITPTTLPDGSPDPNSQGGVAMGEWQVALGFDSFQYVFDLMDHDINPRQVKKLEFLMDVAGDYYIEVAGYSPLNVGDAAGPWIQTEDGYIDMPFRDVIEAPDNYGQDSDFTENRAAKQNDPNEWNPRKIRYEYGAARAAVLLGVDLEGTLWNTFIRAQWSANQKYKQYPTVSKDKIGFTEKDREEPYPGLESEERQYAAYSDTDGNRFEAKLGGDGTDPDGGGEMDRETAWFVNLRQRWGQIFLEAAFYHIDPGYTTTYRNFGANTDRDEDYNLERTGTSTGEDPYDTENYMLIEDDDDNDDWPDDEDFDGVLPQADDRDRNGVLDFQEDFYIFEADPPIFTDLEDLNNNGIIDTLEDDYEPQYPYSINRDGYHITANYEILANMNLKLGRLKESQIDSARHNDMWYFHINYQRDIPDFGTILFQDRFVRVKDDIPDYGLTLRIGELEEAEERDRLDFYNARINTATLQFMYTAVPGLTLETKFLVAMTKQYEPAIESAIVLDDLDTEERDERVDFMVPIEQVQASGDKKEYPFYPDFQLIYNPDNWETRRYEDKNIRNQVTILKAKYEIALGDLPYFDKIGEDLTLTPMVKYIWERAFDQSSEDWPEVNVRIDDEIVERKIPLNPRFVVPTDQESEEYLRFNKRNREDVLGVRLDYQFTQRMAILGGFQYRKFTNRDEIYKLYLDQFPEDEPTPILYRPDNRTRIFEIQAINRGEWLGFNIVVLAGFRRRTDVLAHLSSNTTFVKAMMGF